MMEIFKKKITKAQSRDTGMAMALLLLILFISRKREWFLYGAIGLQVLNMIAPQIFRPVAMVWLAFSELLGTVSSKILLSIVFFGVVTPVGLLRRLFGKDSLKLQEFKASEESVLVVRNHKYSAADLERPF
jgi:polyferredoxin